MKDNGKSESFMKIFAVAALCMLLLISVSIYAQTKIVIDSIQESIAGLQDATEELQEFHEDVNSQLQDISNQLNNMSETLDHVNESLIRIQSAVSYQNREENQ